MCIRDRDVIGDIAGAVDDHIGGDLTQTADEFLGLLLGAGRVGILVLALSQPQYGQIGQLFVGGQVVLDEVDGDALGRKDADVYKRQITNCTVTGLSGSD